jgi:hypothetical protein
MGGIKQMVDLQEQILRKLECGSRNRAVLLQHSHRSRLRSLTITSRASLTLSGSIGFSWIHEYSIFYFADGLI